MPRKIAVDWDEKELRLVAAQCGGGSVKVTDVAVIPIENSSVADTLRAAISRRGLESTETLIAIGRGQAELRELQLPPVPDEELPDMVRFQATRSFATAGDRATVDYLVTSRSDRGIEMIAAAVGPENLTKIRETCESADLTIKRIALRPLAAAALYLTTKSQGEAGDTVLIDLLADDAEIVIARDGHVIFVRTVRMPSVTSARPKVLAGELRRSLVACGSSGSLNRVVLWGLEAVHRDDLKMLAEASGRTVEVLDPFDLVDVDPKVRGDLPEHVGRLAPLVGLLASDEAHADRLIDFLNPRERIEETPNRLKNVLMIGVPIAAVLLIAFFAYHHLQQLDTKIALLKKTNAEMKPDVDEALKRIDRTEKVDQFLDADVNWLDELRRLATTMPPADQMILKTVSASGDSRNGGGTLVVSGAVTNPDVIEEFEEALRDDSHRVVGDGSTQQASADAYKWTLSESITVTPASVRNARYEGLSPEVQLADKGTVAAADQEAEPATPSAGNDPPANESPPEDLQPDTPTQAATESSAAADEATTTEPESLPNESDSPAEQPESDPSPSQPAELPSQPAELPSQPAELPSQPAELAAETNAEVQS